LRFLAGVAIIVVALLPMLVARLADTVADVQMAVYIRLGVGFSLL